MNSSQVSVSGATSYETGSFSLFFPSQWTDINMKSLPTPYYGQVVFAKISPEVKYGFSQNMIVLQSDIATPMSSLRYSEQNALQTSKNYLEYTKLSRTIQNFSDGDTAYLDEFEARYNTKTARMKFLQTAKVCGTKVYLLHITLSLDKDTDKYKELFGTFTCK